MINITFLPIILLPLGCIGLTSAFQVISTIVFLYLYLKNKVQFDYTQFFKSKIVKYSFCFFLLWVCGLVISDFFIKGTATEGWHFFQRILPLILVGLFSVRNEKFFQYAWIGIVISLFIINCDVISNFLIQDHWRPKTMFNSPNRLGGFLILLLPFVFAGIYALKNNFKLQITGSIVLILGLISLIISGSRGAMLGLIGGTFITFVLIKYKLENFKKFILSIFFTSGIILLFIISINFYFPQMISRGYDMERIYLWQSAWEMFKDYPWLGVGGGDFNKYYLNGYINPLAKEPGLVTPHNVYLWYLAERGIVTALPFILMVGFQIYIFAKNIVTKSKKVNLWACAGLIMVLGMAIHGWVDTVMNNRTYQMMYWLLYGLTCYSIVYNKSNYGVKR